MYSVQPAIPDQFSDCLPYGMPADAELVRQLILRKKSVAGFQLFLIDGLLYILLSAGI